MIDSIVLMPYLILALSLSLVVLYISKKNKGKKIAWLFTISWGVSILLLARLSYDDLVVTRNDWLRFNGICILLLSIYIPEVFEVFDKLPFYGNKTRV